MFFCLLLVVVGSVDRSVSHLLRWSDSCLRMKSAEEAGLLFFRHHSVVFGLVGEGSEMNYSHMNLKQPE